MSFINFDLSSAWQEILYLWRAIWGHFVIRFQDNNIDFHSLFYAGVITLGLIQCFTHIFDWYYNYNRFDPDDDWDY